MFRPIIKSRTVLAAAATAAALALPAAASAQTPYTQSTTYAAPCSELYDTAGAYFDVKLCNVSDIDQKRATLPDDGSAYCGPGALFNSLHYLQHRKGVPSAWNAVTKLADVDPLDPNDYAIGSYWLWRLGEESSISSTGTTLTNLQTAFDAATAPAAAAGWTLSRGAVDTNTTAEFGQQMAKHLRFAPVVMAYGRYAQAGNYLVRNGGHIVTVTRVRGYVGANEIKLTLHDPARSADDDSLNPNDGDLDAQSPVQDEEVTLKRVTFNTIVDSRPATVTRWELTGPNYQVNPASPTRQMVEGYDWFIAQKALNP